MNYITCSATSDAFIRGAFANQGTISLYNIEIYATTKVTVHKHAPSHSDMGFPTTFDTDPHASVGLSFTCVAMGVLRVFSAPLR